MKRSRFERLSYRAPLGALLVAGVFAMPAAAQQLFEYTEPPIDPEAESWEVEVDLDLIRSGASAFSILPPSGESVAAELRRFEGRRNGNALWVGRVIGDAHDSLQFTLHGGYLVGTYSGTVGRRFGLRAAPDGRGRLELADLPALPAGEFCGVDDDALSEILLRDREEHGEEDSAGFDLASVNSNPGGIVYANDRFYVVDSSSVFAYDSDGNRASAYDFDLDSANNNPIGITFAGGRFYVVNDGEWANAYDSSGNRASSYDFNVNTDNTSRTLSGGITYGNDRFYVVDYYEEVIWEYQAGGGIGGFDLDRSSDLIVTPSPGGIVYANGRLYVVNYDDHTVSGYDGLGDRASSYDFDLDSNHSYSRSSHPQGITFAGGRFYVVGADRVYAYSSASRQVATGLNRAAPSPPDGLVTASARSGVDVAEANGSYELSVLPLVDPDAVYYWEAIKGSNSQAEIIALYDYANMVFRNNGLSVRIVAPPAARDANGQPVPVWAPLTLLNDRDAPWATWKDPYPAPFYRHSAAVAALRSRFGADLVELFYYKRNPQIWCGVADHIWLSDGTGTPRAASGVARLNGMSQTNVLCGNTTFVHEIGHLLGAMHDGVPEIDGGEVYPCFQEQGGGHAYSCDAYGFFLNSTYPATVGEYPQGIDPTRTRGTIMAYAKNREPFFSSTRVASPIIGGPIGGPRFANNEAVLEATAPEAAFFDQHIPTSPPVDVTVSSDAANIYFSWPTLPLVRGDLRIYYMQDPRFSADRSKASRTDYLPGPYVGDPSTGVSAARPSDVDPGASFFAFEVCLLYNRLEVCSEPVVQGGQTWTTVTSPGNLRVTPLATVDNLVSVQWDDVASEDGYKVQVRAGSMAWREPGLAVEPFAHLVGRNESRAYLWDLDQVGTGREDVLDFRVCAVRRWGDDACSDVVSLERREVRRALAAPYYKGGGGVIGVATGGVRITTDCGSWVWTQEEWSARNAFALRDYGLACGSGGLTVEGLGRGAWYYTRTDPPTAAALFPAGELTGPRAENPGGMDEVDRQAGGTYFRLGPYSTVIPHVKRFGSGPLVAPYYKGGGGVVGLATGEVRVTTDCDSHVWTQEEWSARNAFALRDYDLACGSGGLTVRGLGPGAWYYTRSDPPTAAPLFPESELTGSRVEDPGGMDEVDSQAGGTYFRLGRYSTIIPHVE